MPNDNEQLAGVKTRQISEEIFRKISAQDIVPRTFDIVIIMAIISAIMYLINWFFFKKMMLKSHIRSKIYPIKNEVLVNAIYEESLKKYSSLSSQELAQLKKEYNDERLT